MAEQQNISNSSFTKVIIVVLMLLLISFNVIFVVRYRREKKRRVSLELEKKHRHDKIQQAGFQEIARWKSELRSWPHLEDAIAAIEKQQYNSALDSLNKTIDASGEMEIAYYLRAKIHYQRGDHSLAIEDISFYLERVPSSIHGFLLRARLCLKAGDDQQAEEDLQLILQQRPDFGTARELLQSLRQRKR